MVWAPKNKRPEKLRDNIKEMEVIEYFVALLLVCLSKNKSIPFRFKFIVKFKC